MTVIFLPLGPVTATQPPHWAELAQLESLRAVP